MPKARLLLCWATVAVLALVLRGVLIAPVDGWLAGSLLLGYVSLVVAGALIPQWEMYGDVFWRGDPGQAQVAITFDDGPDPHVTPQVLQVLQRFGMVATFFVLGERAERHPELVRAIVAGGHQLGLHGYRHSSAYAFWAPRRIERDVLAAQHSVFQACGLKPRLFRPPLGHVSPRTAAGARRAGVALVAWSLRSLDGLAQSKPGAIKQRVRAGLGNGSVLLLHDALRADAAPPPSLQLLPELLQLVQERGLQAVSIDELAHNAGWERSR